MKLHPFYDLVLKRTNLIIFVLGSKEKRTIDKSFLSAFESLKDASSKCSQVSGDEGVPNSILFQNGENLKTETPNVKKRHRRMKSSGVKNSEYDGNYILLGL